MRALIVEDEPKIARIKPNVLRSFFITNRDEFEPAFVYPNLVKFGPVVRRGPATMRTHLGEYLPIIASSFFAVSAGQCSGAGGPKRRARHVLS